MKKIDSVGSVDVRPCIIYLSQIREIYDVLTKHYKLVEVVITKKEDGREYELSSIDELSKLDITEVKLGARNEYNSEEYKACKPMVIRLKEKYGCIDFDIDSILSKGLYHDIQTILISNKRIFFQIINSRLFYLANAALLGIYVSKLIFSGFGFFNAIIFLCTLFFFFTLTRNLPVIIFNLQNEKISFF